MEFLFPYMHNLGSLYEYLKSNTNTTWETKINALHDISTGLDHLHDSNLIHQDLHPGNLLFSSNAEWYYDIRRNRKSKFNAQIEQVEKKSEDSSIYDEFHYESHPNAIYSSRILNFTNLSPPVNDSNFDEQLEKLIEANSLSNSNSKI
ncbi:26059_t:CDS:2 [Dentiscutata erythropus]|uniref:26059_t:CDS:1 n=1 Tax=Dentiscutata erythropus TaxID=1348616 RepID=A0A9N9FB69_9GLOM|nr:26059_t:CDS:2 [Dentiscutata erythropus]